MGPELQTCYFHVEKELCEILGIPWSQGHEVDDLLRQVRSRLHAAEGTSEHLAGQIAERMRPLKPTNVPGEDPIL